MIVMPMGFRGGWREVEGRSARHDNNSDYRCIRKITGKRQARYIIERRPDTIPVCGRAGVCACVRTRAYP